MKIENSYIVTYDKSCEQNKLAMLYSGGIHERDESYYIQYLESTPYGLITVLEKIDNEEAYKLIKPLTTVRKHRVINQKENSICIENNNSDINM